MGYAVYKQVHVPNPIEELDVHISYGPIHKHVHVHNSNEELDADFFYGAKHMWQVVMEELSLRFSDGQVYERVKLMIFYRGGCCTSRQNTLGWSVKTVDRFRAMKMIEL